MIKWINTHLDDVVFLLWGSYAQKKGACIDKVFIIEIKYSKSLENLPIQPTHGHYQMTEGQS